MSASIELMPQMIASEPTGQPAMPAQPPAEPILALMAVGMSAGTGALMLLVRIGLQTPLLTVLGGVALVALVTLAPSFWAGNRPQRIVWIGPLALLVLVGSCLTLGLLGPLVGGGLLVALATPCFVFGPRELRSKGRGTRPGIACWLLGGLVVIAGGILAGIALGGTKYVNFQADQLLLHGRTDGDVLLFAAMTNALANFHVPSTGVDGLASAHYHIGFYLLAAGLRALTGGNATLALIVLQSIVLVPIAGFAVAHGARLIGGRLLPRVSFGPLGLGLVGFVLVPLLQLSGFGNLGLHSTSMLVGGAALTLLLPAFFVLVLAEVGDRQSGSVCWWLSVLAVPAIAAAKISAGYLWAAMVGYIALRRLGLKRASFWLVGAGIAALFFASFLAFTDIGGSGGSFFGTPFYVAYGFSKGNYLLPLQVQAQILAAIVCLFFFGGQAERRFRRLLIEVLFIAVLAANLPGLVLEIPGGDAGYFLLAAGWAALPVLALFVAAAPQLLRNAAPGGRIAGWAVVGTLLAGLLAGIVARLPMMANTFVASMALIHTGDRTYYAGDSKKSWRADSKRALATHGFLVLMRLPVAESAGAGLAQALATVRAEFGPGVAAFIPPQSDYWALVPDCDGRSLWPMAVAGVPLIEGFVPDQSACRQEFSLAGHANVPELRTDRTDAELCELARVRGFAQVLRIEDLGGGERLIGCE